jgi:hypothetical protein
MSTPASRARCFENPAQQERLHRWRSDGTLCPMTQVSVEKLEDRLATLECAARFAVYSRFYAAIAILSVALSFMPLFNDVVKDDFRSSYGTLWQMAARPGGGPAVIGVFLLLGLVALLVIAANQVRSRLLPIAIAADGALIAVMLIAKPGTGTPKPDLAVGGLIGLTIALSAMALGVAHAVHLRR